MLDRSKKDAQKYFSVISHWSKDSSFKPDNQIISLVANSDKQSKTLIVGGRINPFDGEEKPRTKWNK